MRQLENCKVIIHVWIILSLVRELIQGSGTTNSLNLKQVETKQLENVQQYTWKT